MKDLLLSNYFWFYAVAWFFTSMCQRSSKNFNGSSETARFILRTVSYVGVLASLAFTITAICILPHWWMALVMWVLCFLFGQVYRTALNSGVRFDYSAGCLYGKGAKQFAPSSTEGHCA